MTDRKDTDAERYLSAGELYRRARKVQELTQIVLECTGPGRRDVARATTVMAQIRAIVGTSEMGAG
ncbi:hypothetical protein PX699_00460 [Sphingobium sp. H39-3-25]|uniref:hypothetical protein n=1 Tax=Sphingobium arseniciresistens TaxID=3030834 RepID=UPI0023B97938|nr:hypothetical protein [Sphingobium arseniciresistens]